MRTVVHCSQWVPGPSVTKIAPVPDRLVFGAAGHLPVVVVDLREERLAGGFEAAKVVLAEPVVVLVEVREVLDLGQLNDPT